MKKIETLISKNDYFYDIPDCIFDDKDFLKILGKAFRVLDSKIDFYLLNIERIEKYKRVE